MMPSEPRRRASSQATRDGLGAAAVRLFLDVGYEATTVRAIAKEASVTIGAFYGHFDSKRSALFEVVRGMNVKGRGGRVPFSSEAERALVFTVASFAHVDDEAATVLGEVLRGQVSRGGELDAQRVAAMMTTVAR